MNRTLVFIFGFLFVLSTDVLAQKPAETLAEYEKKYEWRIRQDILYGVYIPQDLGDAFIQLNRLIDEEDQQKFMELPEEEAANRLFFSFGRWIIHNWGFYGGSRLSNYLRQVGIYHPEDMARFVIITYHRNLHRQPLNVKELVESFQEKARQEQEEKLQEGEILHEETRKRVPDDEG